MATLAMVASGAGINMAIVTGGTGLGGGAPGAGAAQTAVMIGSVGNDRFCGRCLGGTDLTVCVDATNLAGLVAGGIPGASIAITSICSKSVFKKYADFVFVIK